MAGTVVICFTDIVDSTAMLNRVGDDTFDALRRSHFELLSREVDAHGGEIVKNLGDGLMVAFGSASDAVAAAAAMQRATDLAGRTAGAGAIAIRIGISAGDAVQEDGDWFGSPVVEGARLCSAAGAGQILVSEVVRLLAGSRGGHDFQPVGQLELKGLPHPLAASEVQWTPASVQTAVLPGPLSTSESELPFSGRSTPIDDLHQAWKAAGADELRLVLIAGEPGVGKTRLVSEFARSVHADGAVVLLGRADEHIDAPYGPWREVLRALVRAASDEVVASHVAEFGGELSRLVPELARRVDGLPSPMSSDPETERLLLFEGVAAMLASVSGTAPVLLVLDDLHWADRSSLLLLLHLLRMGRPATVLIAATYRDTDVDRLHPLSSVLADLRRERAATRISLDGLDGDGVVELLTAAGGHELDADARAFATALRTETEGNPFFLGEVLRHLIESGNLAQVDGRWRASTSLAESGLPEGVREVVGRRLGGLPDSTNASLGVAAVLGREFDVSMVAAVAGQTVADVFGTLSAAEEARLIAPVSGHPGRYSFAHALVRSTIVEELGTNRRIRLHLASGLAWEATSDPPVGELAYHFGEAAVMGETARAVRYSLAAARQALELAAPEEAVAFARRALQALELADGPQEERVELLMVLGRAMTYTGDTGFMDAVVEAFDAAADAGDWSTAAEAALIYGAGWASVLHDGRAVAQLGRALEHLDEGDSELRSRLLARSSTWRVIETGDRAARDAAEAHAMAVRIGSDLARQRAAEATSLTLRNIDRVAMLSAAEEALQLGRGSISIAGNFALGQKLEALLGLGDLDGLAQAAEETWREFDSSTLRAIPNLRFERRGLKNNVDMTIALLRGRFDEVERIIAEAETERSAFSGALSGFAFTVEFGRTQLAYFRGDWVGAAEGWANTKAIAPGALDVYFGFTGIGCSLVELREYVDAWFRIDAVSPDVTKASNVAVVAEALRRLGDADVAAAYGERFTAHAGFFVTNTVLYCHGPYDTALGILFGTAGQVDRAVSYLEDAVARCDSIGSPSYGVIAQLELATALRVRGARGDLDRSAALTAEVLRTATELGMHGWARRAERLSAGDLEPWRIEADT